MKRKSVLFCVVLMTVLLFNNMSVLATDVSETNQEVLTLVKTNLITGDVENIELDVPSSEIKLEADAYTGNSRKIMPYSIIGEDERTRVPDILMSMHPYSSIGVVRAFFSDGSIKRGTGFLYGPNDVATAAHVIYDADLGPAKTIRFYPGTNGSLTSAYLATVVAIPGEFMDTGALAYDYGVFDLSSNIGNSLGYFGWTQDVTVGNAVQITGYPGDKVAYQMWMAGKGISLVTEKTIGYYVDTESGQSGAPVYYGTTCEIVGIHCQGGSFNNSGKRVDNRLAAVLSYGRTHNVE